MRAPPLRPGQVGVVDTLSVHHAPMIEALTAARDCRVLFLPASSPDLNPIAPAFATITAYLRRVGARSPEALDQAIAEAIALVTPEDRRGFVRHAGYPRPVQT